MNRSNAFNKQDSLKVYIGDLLKLAQEENSLKTYNSLSLETSLKKATSPRFEIVFAGAFSAGKSMLINALLEQELLYSSEGHATGTECYIEYAEPEQERIELTFLSKAEIRNEAASLISEIENLLEEDWDYTELNFEDSNLLENLHNDCEVIIHEQGGARKSEIAKKADALRLIIEGFKNNTQWIYPDTNAVRSMDDLKLVFNQAAEYARRGSNSAVLKRINYFFNHPLLERGNVIVDLPGIDAPVEKDAQLTYKKIADPEISAVICVLKIASEGEVTTEETQLLQNIRKNPGIRDRVFFVFNRIDETWYNNDLAKRLTEIKSDFVEEENKNRVYQTSALLGFYGSQIKNTNKENRFGIDTILNKNQDIEESQEFPHQFVYEFNRYCASNKLTTTKFEITTSNRQTENEKYLNTLEKYEQPLINQLIDDSGVKQFRESITSYLVDNKHRELFENLADDLDEYCRHIKQYYEDLYNDLSGQPDKPEDIKAQEFANIKIDLQNIADSFKEDMLKEVLKVASGHLTFEKDYEHLKNKMLSKLEELLNGFFLWDAYESARKIHRQYITVPLLSILGEAFYYLTSKLENVLAQECEKLVAKFFERLINHVCKQDYYKELKRFLGEDVAITTSLSELKSEITTILKQYAHQECEYYLREDPEFYTDSYNHLSDSRYTSSSEGSEDEEDEEEEYLDEEEYSENEDDNYDEKGLDSSIQQGKINNKVGIYQFREALQQTFQNYTKESIESVQPVVRQLLHLDFQNKVEKTINQTFRHTFNSIINDHIQTLVSKKYQEIIHQDECARKHLDKLIENDAIKKVSERNCKLREITDKSKKYNEIIKSINLILKDEGLGNERLIPEIIESIQTKEAVAENSDLFNTKSVGKNSTEQTHENTDETTSNISEDFQVEPAAEVSSQKIEKKPRKNGSGFLPKTSK
ncbi:MAG: dynamin-like GTPase family protein [Nostoc sp. DedSLP03]|uniref:dynamin-like GTPase family protein n=1 Tax=Nostoc sp. DedSLP03 TaxID=3075400 RepID=UPI002AD4D5A7|nr:dynamin-like GTPase family protein [Nostoc sp. DedSLP03]MDZ7969243.1 dynamin-like GTPase family protein [Nostoc sp. DedSLP03]